MAAPAGWYTDGSGQRRWWDGTQWTEHVVDPVPSPPAAAVEELPAFAPPFVLPAQTTMPPTVAASAIDYRGVASQTHGPTERRRSRKGLVFGLIGVSVVVVVGAVVAIPFFMPSEQPTAGEEGQTPQIAPWESRTHEPEAEEADNPPEPEEEETVYWDEIELGDCWRYDEDDWSTGYADIVACELTHSDEIYYTYMVDGAEYPGDKTVLREATDVCMAEFGVFVGVPYEDSELDFWAITPTEVTWNTADDRAVQCSIFDPETTALTGTLKGADR